MSVIDYIKGVSRKGNCGECGHGARPASGCKCKSQWCPCHAKWKGHKLGFHSCNCK